MAAITHSIPDSISGRFAATVANHGGRTAIRAAAGQWTYAELGQSANLIAAEICGRRGDASEPVALLLEHDAPLIAAILGTLEANKMYLVLDPARPPEQLAAMLANSGSALLLADASNLPLAQSLAGGKVTVLPVAEISSKAEVSPNRLEVSGEAAAWLMYTSGSTHAPKGVWQNHRGMVQEAEMYAKLAGCTVEDRVSLTASCSLAASGGTLFATLLTGATLCLFHVRSHGVERLADWLARECITIFHTVPTIFRHLAQVAGVKNSFETMRLIRLGGEPVFPGDLEIFQRQCPDGCHFMQSLSSTETGMISTFSMDKNTALESTRIPAGRPVAGVDIFLMDEHGQPVKNGDEGKIAVRGARLRQGYWRQPELTAEKFKADGHDPSQRIFISNDLGRFLPDGLLEHLGRADELVKIRGQRADLGEVEAALQATGLFEASAAAAVENAAGDRRLVGYIVPRPGADVSAQNCRRALRASLPEHMVPGEFIVLNQLPQTVSGKLDRRALPVPPERLNPKEGDKPHDRFEMKLGEIWKSVLRLDAVGMTDDFFEQGGDSLRAVEVLVQIEERFGVALSPSAVAEHSTIRQLAMVVANEALGRSASPLVTLRESPTGRPLFLVHNGHGDITTFARLARRLPGRPIHGLQSVGLDGAAWPLMSVPEMAKRYLEEVVKVDPTGPYLIAGTCMGGLIAFEMAQQLVRAGRPVALLAVIVTPAPPYTGGRSRWHEMLLDPVRDAFRILRWTGMRLVQPKLKAHWLPQYRHFIAGMNSRAGRRYRPAIYPGKITVINTTDTTGLREDRRRLMAEYAQTSQIIDMSYPNGAILSPPAVDELAEHFKKCLGES
ncbi:MAG TPA: AMP-binding protein [Verrucomicrobiae bacterium]|nr:AMP-binding protein [Verrucomicrobiae bacterium]